MKTQKIKSKNKKYWVKWSSSKPIISNGAICVVLIFAIKPPCTQPAFTCTNSTMETPEQCVKSVQS